MKRIGTASLVLLSGCVLGPQPRFAHHVAEGTYCAPREALEDPGARRGAEEASLPARAAIERGYTPRALDIARAIGALAQVERLADAASHHATDAQLADLRGEVNDTITRATLDLASTVANLGCEEGRATQIASDLRAAEGTQTRNITAYSLLLSASAAIAAGVIAVTTKNPIPGGVVGIGGGLAGSGFGVATLAVHRSATFRHTHNILGQVWRGGAHPSFPEIVWAYLTRPQFSRTGDQSLRDYLVSTWKVSALGGDPPEERIALYFGEGGDYDASALDDRANMLSDVREVVSLMNHGLRQLAAEVAQR